MAKVFEHAAEVYNQWLRIGKAVEDVFFFDKVRLFVNELFKRTIYYQLTDIPSLQIFLTGTGNLAVKNKLYQGFLQAGHRLMSMISPTANISTLIV